MKTAAANALVDRFGRSGSVVTARAPGRVNLIGEHTDYNQGFVLPTPIDRFAEASVRRLPGSRIRMLAVDAGEVVEFQLGDSPDSGWPGWAFYLYGLAEELRRRGLLDGGFDLAVRGTVPQGTGLGSSAALETAAALALERAFDLALEPLEVARLCRDVEHRWAGVHCGIMDQMASRLGRAGHALLIDCRDLKHRQVPLTLDDCSLVISDSGVRRKLGDSAYNKRRQECEHGVNLLRNFDPGIRSLRDLDGSRLAEVSPSLPDPIASRCRHVVEENARVLEAEARLTRGDLPGFGELMVASHESLRDLFEVSHPGLDRLVEAARGVDGVLGSRMTGAGFGGCTVTLCAASAVDELRDRMDGVFKDLRTDGSVMVVSGAVEAGLVEIST